MAVEIERKFLVTGDFPHSDPVAMQQGYLYTDANRTIRVRTSDSKAWLTIKGKTQGISRAEFEYEIPKQDARELLKLATTPLVEKTRYHIVHQRHTWEVDIFHGENEGLILAEIELDSEDEHFTLPHWLGKEVSGDHRYTNSSLSQNPYQSWQTE